ncbi:MAG TPA: hypothetical protein VJ818_07005 [Actinomycetota bacterium]|nr:hypothetical protein [Actinomycetota bacterium]
MKRTLRRMLRALDRVLLGPIMSVGAFIIERRVVRAIKEKPVTAAGSDPTRAQG